MQQKETRLRKALAVYERRAKIESTKCARHEAVLRNLKDDELRFVESLQSDCREAFVIPELLLGKLRSVTQGRLCESLKLERQRQLARDIARMSRRIESAIERVERRRRGDAAADEKRRLLELLHNQNGVSSW